MQSVKFLWIVYHIKKQENIILQFNLIGGSNNLFHLTTNIVHLSCKYHVIFSPTETKKSLYP